MNYKRKRPRNRRAGCKLCKFWKINGFSTERREGEKFSDHRRRRLADEELIVTPYLPSKPSSYLLYTARG